MGLRIRERPSLRLNAVIRTPSGRSYRWAGDEHNAETAPSFGALSTTMPGGFDQGQATLPRKPGADYSDIQRLSTLTVYGAGGSVIWEGRLETVPRSSGDQMSVSPGLVGWQNHLTDNQAVQMVYVNQDVATWGDMPLNEKIRLAAAGISQGDFSWSSDKGGLICALPNQALGANTEAEIWYVAPAGVKVGKIMYVGADTTIPGGYEGAKLYTNSTDILTGAASTALTLDSTLRSQAVTTPARYAALAVWSNGTAATPASGAQRVYKHVAVYGDHGLTTYPVDTLIPDGLLASDVIAHALARWAPLLDFSTGVDGTIQPSSFVVPHLTFPDLTTVSEIVKQAIRFELLDWAVWEKRCFWMNARGARGRKWRARARDCQLQETGPQVDRLWNSIVVQYQDVDGTNRTVGPPGSGCDTEDASLVDLDPANPANQIPNLARQDALQMGTNTAAAAVQVGARFLGEQKFLDSSGQAQLIGHVEDDHGVLWPVSEVRGGDRIAFVDASDFGYRRVVKTSYDDASKGNSVDLDSPPDGLQEVLERLGVELIPFGL